MRKQAYGVRKEETGTTVRLKGVMDAIRAKERVMAAKCRVSPRHQVTCPAVVLVTESPSTGV
jgi:hypothetical protein